jgi:hypothetical protein
MALALESEHTRGRELLRWWWWPVGQKLVFDQMAAPVPEIMDGTIYIYIYSPVRIFWLPRVEACKNTSTVVPASRKRRRSGNTVSDETVMYCYWSSVTWPVNDCTVSNRPVFSSERAPYRKNNKAIVTKERVRIKSDHGPQRGARYQDELVDWPSAVK